eukprot:SAG31_NODE_1476_length_8195_cov_2.521863_6_plen_115_part_00
MLILKRNQANILEAVEVGSSCLLVDEDTAATNFMIRSAAMQRLVAKDKEPITPFIAKVRPLAQQHGISSVLVIGARASCVIIVSLTDTVFRLIFCGLVGLSERVRWIRRLFRGS